MKNEVYVLKKENEPLYFTGRTYWDNKTKSYVAETTTDITEAKRYTSKHAMDGFIAIKMIESNITRKEDNNAYEAYKSKIKAQEHQQITVHQNNQLRKQAEALYGRHLTKKEFKAFKTLFTLYKKDTLKETLKDPETAKSFTDKLIK